MLGAKRDRYKHGYLRKVERSKGFAWEFRVDVGKGGAREVKYITLNGAEYPTEKAARQKLQSMLLKVNEGNVSNVVQAVIFGTVLDKYIEEEMPAKASTRGSYTSIIDTHLRPKWGAVAVTEMKAQAIRNWLRALPLAPLSKGHIRSLMHKMFDLAMMWEYIPVARNPLELVKIQGVTKREKVITILTPKQAAAIIASLPEPYSLMLLTVATLGLRLSEMLGLMWSDFDFDEKTVTIKRSAYRGSIDEAKTPASHATLSVPDELISRLLTWREKCKREVEDGKREKYEWVFPNPATGQPYMGPSLQQQWLRPAGEKVGVKGLGFHTFRHSYKTWLDSLGTPMGIMKDLMRHSNISVTMNTYGKTQMREERLYNAKVGKLLFPPKKSRKGR